MIPEYPGHLQTQEKGSIMADGWSLLKRVWAKKTSGIAESLGRDERKRIDLNLPLGLRAPSK